MLESQARRLGGRPALSLPEATLSYIELDALANRAASMLAGLGYGAGDLVMARCHNSLTVVATWLGAIKLGAVFMPVNSLLSGAPLRSVMAHAGGRVVAVDADLLAPMLEVCSGLPELRHILVAESGASRAGLRLSGTAGGISGSDAAMLSFAALLDDAAAQPPPALDVDPAAPARLMYTSGTTGRPKGVIWSRNAEAHHACCYGDELVRVDQGENVYSCLPLFHATCQGTLLGTLWRGGHAHIDRGFDAFGFWGRIRTTGAVFFPYVGTLLSVLAKRPRRPDDADNPVRRVMGSAAPADRWREIEDRFALAIEDVWGQTELASCWTRPTSIPARPGSVGRPTPRFEARLVDGSGAEPAAGEAGEIWVRPLLPHLIFEGYFRDEKGSAAMWTADGWYRSGDLMRRDPDGDLVFAGRLRDAIRRRGEMLSPADIEEAALAEPAVLEAAAVGVPAPDGVEEEVKLCVVLQPGAVPDLAALHAALQRRLPSHLVPRYLALYADFPKTPTTRIQKYRLRDDGLRGAWDSRRRRRDAVGRRRSYDRPEGS